MILNIVVCADLSEEDPLRPGYTAGYACESCRKPIQISPFAIGRIKAGGKPLCNPCGFKFMETNHAQIERADFSPIATEKLIKNLKGSRDN